MENLQKFKSKEWRINHLYKVINKQSQLVTFKEFDCQRQIRTCTSRVIQILKFRQIGITTGCSIDLLDDAIFIPNTTAMILAHRQKDLDKIFNKVKIAYKKMDPRIRPIIDKGGGSRFEMRFPEINSKIFTDIENRGDTVHRLHVSEAAYVEPPRLKATLGAVVPHGRITHESTANGMQGDYYKHWADPNSPRAKLFFPWFIQKEYQTNGDHVKGLTIDEKELKRFAKKNYGIEITRHQIAWRREMIQEYGDMFFQEFPENDISCFLASGACPIDQVLVTKLMKQVKEPISDDGTLKVWEPFVDGNRYIVSADVAQGVRADYSVADVWRLDTMEQVAQYRSNNIKPFPFGAKLVEIANLYWMGGRPWPLISAELNNHGHAVNGYLYNTASYSNIYCYKDDTQGWLTNTITRPKMIDTFIDGLESETIKVNSLDTLGECLTLVDNGGKIEATDGENDDTIISGAIGVQMIISEGSSSLYDNLNKRILL